MTAPVPQTDAERRRAQAALFEFGCPRPDKHHYLSRTQAAEGLERAIHLHHEDARDEHRTVYQCPCGGWVWGRWYP